MQGEGYQKALIASGLVVTILFGVFVYKELFPEYKKYQNRYLEIEQVRTEFTKQKVPFFKSGIKQVVIAQNDKGPEKIDRCTSCHVALDLPHFSKTKPAYDLQGNLRKDENGAPILIENKEYIWGQLDQKILALRDDKKNQELIASGKQQEVAKRLEEANHLDSLKYIEISGRKVDARKVLSMHPLIGNESSPFELHSIETYGCSTCHSGNGRALTFQRAHGPLLDGDYPTESHAPKPSFLEIDENNDPQFAKMFNHKPGPSLLFQTEPILVGGLIESSCLNCHDTNKVKLSRLSEDAQSMTHEAHKQLQALEESIKKEKASLINLFTLLFHLEQKGYEEAYQDLEAMMSNLSLDPELITGIDAQLSLLKKQAKHFEANAVNKEKTRIVAYYLKDQAEQIIGKKAFSFFYKSLRKKNLDEVSFATSELIQKELLAIEPNSALSKKLKSVESSRDNYQQLALISEPVKRKAQDVALQKSLSSSLDEAMKDVLEGEKLFVSQGCYACHTIERLSKGSVGPDLSKSGLGYPWYLKESIVWPQGNIKTSTMPNFRLDHDEVEKLLAFLMAQKGPEYREKDSAYHYKFSKAEWEKGKKMRWEEAVSPHLMDDIDYAKMVFASEGCASCHSLKGFSSSVGYDVEKSQKSSDAAYWKKRDQAQDRFRQLFPKNILGSRIAQILTENAQEIDSLLNDNIQEKGDLEKISEAFPGMIDAFYSNFKFASRTRNQEFEDRLNAAFVDLEKENIQKEKQSWERRLNKVKMMYVKEYGLGREIGPNLHYSGIHRTKEWLMGHFTNPQGYVTNSIMPLMPFDETKFATLTHLLEVLAQESSKELHRRWASDGFNPKKAFELHCASCHGSSKKGDGVVAEMLYPIPKDLTSATFLRGLSKQRAVDSILHGVKGTPMAPWGEAQEGRKPVLNKSQVTQLVDWLFLNLPGDHGEEFEVEKWQYTPSDVIKELKNEGASLKNQQTSSGEKVQFQKVSNRYLEKQTLSVQDVFDEHKNQDGSLEKSSYFIKQKFYNDFNLEEGRHLFVMSCAQCHGEEGEGNGNRAEAMVEAKPRALTNFNWIDSRDDLRLLRSIKYGVPGTSMTPWGDKTSASQRVQLVVFIRSLSKEKAKKRRLEQIIYQSVERSTEAVSLARTELDKQIAKQEQVYQDALKQKEQLQASLNFTDEDTSKSLEAAFHLELTAFRKLKELKDQDGVFLSLINTLDKEKEIIGKLGKLFINLDPIVELSPEIMVLLDKFSPLFSFEDGKFFIAGGASPTEEQLQRKKQVLGLISNKRVGLIESSKHIQARLPTTEKTEAYEETLANSHRLESSAKEFAVSIEQIYRLREKQLDYYKKLNSRQS